jgi:hypothetical protein
MTIRPMIAHRMIIVRRHFDAHRCGGHEPSIPLPCWCRLHGPLCKRAGDFGGLQVTTMRSIQSGHCAFLGLDRLAGRDSGLRQRHQLVVGRRVP